MSYNNKIYVNYPTDRDSHFFYSQFLFHHKFIDYNKANLVIHHGIDDSLIYKNLVHNKHLVIQEDGFIRSCTTWTDTTKPIKYRYSIAYTFGNYPHFYAKSCSTLEYMLNDRAIFLDNNKINRAQNIIKKLVDNKITKYNHQPIYTPKIGRKYTKKVLVVDQSYGDKSIEYGLANSNTFKIMLQNAITQNPHHDIIIKTHPDSLAVNSPRKMTYYSKHDTQEQDNIYLLTDTINPLCLLEIVDKVYVCTSQLGFEALLLNKEVHVFGMPFYAGYGLTIDYQKCKRRTHKRSIEEVFYIAYIMYTHYVCPDTKKRCEIEDAIEYLIKLRKEYFREYNIRCDDKRLM